MTALIKTSPEQQKIIEQVIVMGDLAKLTPEQRNLYYKAVCDSLGVNPLTRPFEYITLNGKLTLYARKDATDQLRKIHGVSVRIADRSTMDDLMVVTAEATDKAGRTDASIGAVSIAGLRGEAKANALMKAETKARRRVTLALCGLGILDESEIESIPNARIGEPPQAQPRGADRILAHQDAAMPQQQHHAVVDGVVAPKAVAPEAPKSEPANADSGFAVIDVHEIEEHRSANGPIWKVVTAGGDVFACADDVVVGDISTAKAADRPVRVEWQQRGKKRLILSAEGVTE